MNLENRNILYGDDDKYNQVRIAQSLREKNYNVDLVSSPNEFVYKAKNGNYNAVVSDLDYSPKGAEGYEVIRQIRKTPCLKLLFTGRAGFENVVEALEGGADGVVLGKDIGQLVRILDKELNSGVKK